jgi:hypothetical protein
MNWIPYATTFLAGGLFGAAIALNYADRIFRKSRGPKPVPATERPWYDQPPAILRPHVIELTGSGQ